MKTSGWPWITWLGGSPLTGLRMMRTPVTPMSSTAHPVTAIEPVTPVELLAGVSKAPIGRAVDAGDTMFSVTGIGDTLLPALVNERTIAPDCVLCSAAWKTMEMFNVADPDPVASLPADPDPLATRSHGTFAVADHVTVPAPLCVRRIACVCVCDVNADPFDTALKINDVLSTDITGPIPFCTIVNVKPPMLRVAVRFAKFPLTRTFMLIVAEALPLVGVKFETKPEPLVIEAVQLQPEVVVSVTLTLPPLCGTVALERSSAKLQLLLVHPMSANMPSMIVAGRMNGLRGADLRSH